MGKYNEIVVGIDQSYKNTGISIAADGVLRKVTSKHMESYKNNSERRRALAETLDGLFGSVTTKGKVVCIVERIRLQSNGVLNMDYIKSIGALNAVIVDVCYKYGVQVYSVDTRSWKAQVVGTSKPKPNKYGVPEEKWPTVMWCIKQGFRNSILEKASVKKKKGIFIHNGVKYMYNNDASDSAGIAMYWFKGDREKLKEEH